MVIALLAARILLAALFATAGIAKLMDRRNSRQALTGFGIPAVLAAPLGTLLPVGELVVAIALVTATSAWWGALAALSLLLIFTAAIGINLLRGRMPECHCFGQLHFAPAGWPAVTRNATFAAVAGFVVWQGRVNAGPSLLGWMSTLATSEIVVLITAAIVLGLLSIEGWFLHNLLRQNGRLLLRVEAMEKSLGGSGTVSTSSPTRPQAGLPVGAPAPGFSLAGLYAETLTLDGLRALGKPVLLIFSDPGCGPCNALMPDIARWQREHSAITIALVSRGNLDVNRAGSAEHGVSGILLQKNREVAEAYRANGTPAGQLVGTDGTITSPLATGLDAIRELVARTVGAATQARAPAAATHPAAANGKGNGTPHSAIAATNVGDHIPEISLPDLNGRTIDSADFRGSSTLILFWNPGCGFCRRMLDDLKAWERNPPPGAPVLLVVSTGSVEANQAMGLRSQVVLDQSFSTARLFGAKGTPSAVLINSHGRIASPVVSGIPAVLALAGNEVDQATPTLNHTIIKA